MANPKFTNFARTTLNGAVSSATASPITFNVTDGSLFPSPGAGEYFPVVLTNTSGQREVMACTSRTGNALTCTRAQDGTSQYNFSSGDVIGCRLTMGSLADLLAQNSSFVAAESSVAAATTTDLGASASVALSSGTGTINNFTVYASGTKRFVRVTGALTITTAGNIAIPWGSSAAFAAGESFWAESIGSTWIIGPYTASQFPTSTVVAHGQCKLAYVNATQLLLSPLGGNLLTVNGVACTIPDAGVSYTASGLSNNTRYFVYATQSAGVVNALELSATGHSTSATAGNKGVEIKTGDDTRTLVGMVYTTGSGQFQDDNTARYVRTWFHDTGVVGISILSANTALANAGAFGAFLNVYTLVWANERVNVYGNMTAAEGSGVTQAHLSIISANGSFIGASSEAVSYPSFYTNTSPHAVTSLGADGAMTLSLNGLCSTGYYTYAVSSATGITYATAGR